MYPLNNYSVCSPGQTYKRELYCSIWFSELKCLGRPKIRIITTIQYVITKGVIFNIQEKIIGWYISATTMLTIVVGYQSGYPSADHWMLTHTIVTIQLINRQFLIPKIVKNASPKLLKRVLWGFALQFVKDLSQKFWNF